MKRIVSSNLGSTPLIEVLPNMLDKHFNMFIYDEKTSSRTGSIKFVYYDGPDYNTPEAEELRGYLDSINSRIGVQKILYSQRVHGTWILHVPDVEIPIELL